MILVHVDRHGDRGGLLLVVFRSLQIPLLGQEIATFARLYPIVRASLVRILEPLQSLEQEAARSDERARAGDSWPEDGRPGHPAR